MDFKSVQRFFLTVPVGFEHLALFELYRVLGSEAQEACSSTKIFVGGLEVELPLGVGLSLNRYLKIPVRILLRLKEFECLDKEAFQEGLRGISWADFGAISDVEVSARSSKLHIEKQISRWFFSSLPKECQSKKNGSTVYIRFFRDMCTVSIDSSGEPLYKRGANKQVGEAPIRDNMAAGLLQLACQGLEDLSGYELVDPFAGSGTFLLEGLTEVESSQRTYSFEAWSVNKDKETNMCQKPWPVFTSGIALDKNQQVIKIAQKNLSKTKPVRVEVEDLFESDSVSEHQNRMVISNLPYGHRIPVSDHQFFNQSLKKIIEVYAPKRCLLVVPIKAQLETPPEYDQPRQLLFKNNGIDVKAQLFVKQ